jgi:hypothetical protein
MWLSKDVSINEARKTWDDGHAVVNLVGWRALKMIVLVIRDLEESYDPKRIEVAELYEADGVR